MTRAGTFWLALTVAAVLAGGVGVVYVKYQSRLLFVDLQKVRAQTDQALGEWGRLQLELATEGDPENVMRIAGSRLRMHMPEAGSVVVVE